MQKSKRFNPLFFLLVFLAILSAFLSFYPLYVSGPRAVFFNFEPTVVYTANAFRYMYTGRIFYSSHPATPSIVLLSHAFLPLRIYAKLFEQIPFFLWVIRNVFDFFYYARLIQAFLSAVATSIFLLSVYNLTRKHLSVVIAFLGLWIYSFTPYLGLIVQSEPLSFLILSLWFLAFSEFIQKRKMFLYFILCGLSGLALANKLSNVTFVFASLLLSLTLLRKSFREKVSVVLKGSITAVGLFIVGTLPISGSYADMLGFVGRLVTHSGIHGGGERTIFSLADYLSSARSLLIREKIAAVLVLVTIFLFLGSYKKLRRLSKGPMSVLLISMVLGILLFAKYPLVHYQFFQYVSILLIFSYLVSRIFQPLQILIIAFLIPFSFNTLTTYWGRTFKAMEEALVLENYVDSHPPKEASIWGFGSSADFALIHIRDWSGYPFSDFLLQERPKLYGLTTDLSKVVLGPGQKAELFDFCWDQLYIQKARLDVFKEKYLDRDLKIEPIPNSIRNMYIVTSNHCSGGINDE